MSSDQAQDGGNVNEGIFRDVLFNTIIEKSTPKGSKDKSKKSKAARSKKNSSSSNDVVLRDTSRDAPATDPTELVDFSDYLAGEIFPSLPEDLQFISHQALQDSEGLSDKWSLPLSLTTYEEIADLVPPAIPDSLESYGLIDPPSSDVQSFLSPVITTYLTQATAPLPKWVATKTDACEICDRGWIPLTYHHLIPKETHEKVLKRGWHDERMLNSVAWLCRACHSFVHRMASNEELAREYFTIEKIYEREDVQKFAAWMSTVRWKAR